MRRIFEKKTAHIRGEKHSVEDFFVQQAAIWAEFSKVVCISCAYIQQKHILRIKNFYGDDELALLTEFIALLNKCWNSSDGFLCAHNAKKFHFPFLCRRILINNLHIPYALDVQGKKPWEIKHLDTMELWQFGDQRHFTSLELLAEVFNITNKTNRKENKVYHMYYEGEKKWNDIVQGCQESIQIVAQVFRRYKSEKLLSKVVIGKDSSFF